MSSTTPLTDAINALTTYANEITGQSDTTLSDAVESLVDGYGGGGSAGGLANLADVIDTKKTFGYMLSAMKNGNTKGGTVTFTTAFANTEQLILQTGLSEIHGIIFAVTDYDTKSTTSSVQSNKFFFMYRFDADNSLKYMAVGLSMANAFSVKNNQSLGTKYEASPENGTLRFDGGDIYYTARYNKNASYQILYTNHQYDWLAW